MKERSTGSSADASIFPSREPIYRSPQGLTELPLWPENGRALLWAPIRTAKTEKPRAEERPQSFPQTTRNRQALFGNHASGPLSDTSSPGMPPRSGSCQTRSDSSIAKGPRVKNVARGVVANQLGFPSACIEHLDGVAPGMILGKRN